MSIPGRIVVSRIVLVALAMIATGAASAQVQSQSELIYAAGGNSSLGIYSYDATGSITGIGFETYVYDAQGRLTEGSVTVPGQGQKSQTIAYDLYGNITTLTTNGSTRVQTIAAANNNRIATVTIDGGSVANYSYDARGNFTGTEYVTYTWDALDAIARVQESGRDVRYVYTAGGERIGTKNGSKWTWTVRDLGGKVLREYEGTTGAGLTWKKDYLYRGSALLSSITPEGMKHYTLDHLGTPRLVTDSAGEVISQHTYHPFGQEATVIDETERMHFTGHERDYGTGRPYDLDYMHARYYSPVMGRFLSVDPADSARLGMPQSWNRYSYAINNPTRYIDPNGEDFWDVLVGAGEAVRENLTLGAIRRSAPTNDDHAFGQAVGDAASVVVALAEIDLGAKMAAGGGFGTVLSGGSASPVTVTVAGGGVILGAHGTGVLINAGTSLMASSNSRGSGSGDDAPREITPNTGTDAFSSMRGRDAKVNKKTGEVWVRDRLHKDHWEVYKNQKQYEKGARVRSVWDDGRLKETF